MKKMLTLILSFVIVLSLAVPCLATSVDTDTSGIAPEDFSYNFHVSTVNPLESIQTRGTTNPTKAWNIQSNGPYYFRGKAAYSRLYLDYLITGSHYFSAHVKNNANTTLTINPHDSVDTHPIPLTAKNEDDYYFMLREGKIYFLLSFEAPSDFEGNVYGYIDV